MRAACTIVSKNYFAYASVLYHTFHEKNPDVQFFILLVDKVESGEKADFAINGAAVLSVEELGIQNFKSIAFKYNILELNTNVKPTLLKWILSKGFESVLYLDPDIMVYKSLGEVYALLEDECDIVLTPHILTPVDDSYRPDDAEYLKNGVFNFGFVGVAAKRDGSRFLDWWEKRCLEQAYNEPRSGIFVDQKWANLVPCFFERHKVLRAPGMNMAYWNLHERKLKRFGEEFFVNDSFPLIFFHFSGLTLNDPDQISKHQNRYTLKERPDLKELFDSYREELRKAGHMRYSRVKYAFGTFSNGTPIPDLVRKIYAGSRQLWQAAEDPFDADGEFYSKVRSKGLLNSGPALSAKTDGANQMTFSFSDPRHRVLRVFFRLIVRIIKVNRYSALLRYLSFITIPRNQARIFFD